jgi:hypothetical protein
MAGEITMSPAFFIFILFLFPSSATSDNISFGVNLPAKNKNSVGEYRDY